MDRDRGVGTSAPRRVFTGSVCAHEATTALEAGDAAYIPAHVAGEIRNEGQERAVRLAILVLPPEEMMGAATSAP